MIILSDVEDTVIWKWVACQSIRWPMADGWWPKFLEQQQQEQQEQRLIRYGRHTWFDSHFDSSGKVSPWSPVATQLQKSNTDRQINSDPNVGFFLGGGEPLSLHPITSFQFHHPIPMFLILFSASPSQNFIYTVVILIEFGVIDSTDWMVFQSRPLKEVIGYIQSHWTWSWWVNMDLIPITLIYRLCYERVFVGRGRARA